MAPISKLMHRGFYFFASEITSYTEFLNKPLQYRALRVLDSF
jgi:hypothetical protein